MLNIQQRIDSHTDITYQVSAPGAGGLVKSRDFVNLRCWHALKNGSIVQDDDDKSAEFNMTGSFSPETKSSALSSSHTSQKMHKSFSEVEIQDEDRKSVDTLSKSLGAKSFSVEVLGSTNQSEEDDEDDAFADAEDKDRSATPVAPSDRLYMTTAIHVEYDRMPPVSKYTRFVKKRERRSGQGIDNFLKQKTNLFFFIFQR